MTRQQRFAFAFDVSLEFLAQEPTLAAKWIDARRDAFAAVTHMSGPRGGAYRLTTPPDDWRVDIDPFWHPTTATYLTKRWGSYVRPSRVSHPSDTVTFGTFTIPVKNGKAMTPRGEVIETESEFVVVPVPPGSLPNEWG